MPLVLPAAGWLWPPQIRKRLLEERITKQRGVIVRTEIRKNEIIALKNEIVKAKSRVSEREGELNEIKTEMILFQKEISDQVETIASLVNKLKKSMTPPAESDSLRSRSFQSPPTIVEKNDDNQ